MKPESTRATGEVAGEVTGEVGRLVLVLLGEMKRAEMQKVLGLRHEDYFREAYLVPALEAGYVEMTIPEKPKSSKQKYRLTPRGKALLVKMKKTGKTHPISRRKGKAR